MKSDWWLRSSLRSLLPRCLVLQNTLVPMWILKTGLALAPGLGLHAWLCVPRTRAPPSPVGLAPGPAPRLPGLQPQGPGLQNTHTTVPIKAWPWAAIGSHSPWGTGDLPVLVSRNPGKFVHQHLEPCLCSLRLPSHSPVSSCRWVKGFENQEYCITSRFCAKAQLTVNFLLS